MKPLPEDTKHQTTYRQFTNITSALMGPIVMLGLVGYGLSRYTGLPFGLEGGILLGSIAGMWGLLKQVSHWD